MHHLGEGLAALLERDPRAALEHLLEALPGMPALGGSRVQQEVVLAMLAKVPINVVDRLMTGDRPDAVLILCKAIGLGWPTVRSIVLVRSEKGTSSQVLDSAFANYGRLSVSTAKARC